MQLALNDVVVTGLVLHAPYSTKLATFFSVCHYPPDRSGACYIRCMAFKPLSYFILERVKRGQTVIIEGFLAPNAHDAAETLGVVADNVVIMDVPLEDPFKGKPRSWMELEPNFLEEVALHETQDGRGTSETGTLQGPPRGTPPKLPFAT